MSNEPTLSGVPLKKKIVAFANELLIPFARMAESNLEPEATAHFAEAFTKVVIHETMNFSRLSRGCVIDLTKILGLPPDSERPWALGHWTSNPEFANKFSLSLRNLLLKFKSYEDEEDEPEKNTSVSVKKLFENLELNFVEKPPLRKKPNVEAEAAIEHLAEIDPEMTTAEALADPSIMKRHKKDFIRQLGVYDGLKDILLYRERNPVFPNDLSLEETYSQFKKREDTRAIVEILGGQWSGDIIFEILIKPLVLHHALKLENLSAGHRPLKKCPNCKKIFATFERKKVDAHFCKSCKTTPQIHQRLLKKKSEPILPFRPK